MASQRDKIWSAALQLMEYNRGFSAADVEDHLGGNSPAIRTIRECLDSIESLGFLESSGGAGRAPRIYNPVEEEPVRPPPGYTGKKYSNGGTFPWPGSKSGSAEWIISKMPQHDTYIELFGGSATVLYQKPPSKYEILNDVNDDVIQFFEVLRDSPDELADWLSNVPYSRSQYQEWVDEYYAGYRPDDPIERAGRFVSLRYMQFVGVSDSANGFKTRARRSAARTFRNAVKRIESVAERFEEVTIENRGFDEIIEQYDTSAVQVLFYADPPYRGSRRQYGQDFDRGSFVRALLETDSDWMVSVSEVPDCLAEYTVFERSSRHRMKRANDRVREYLVCNFDPDARQSFVYHE